MPRESFKMNYKPVSSDRWTDAVLVEYSHNPLPTAKRRRKKQENLDPDTINEITQHLYNLNNLDIVDPLESIMFLFEKSKFNKGYFDSLADQFVDVVNPVAKYLEHPIEHSTKIYIIRYLAYIISKEDTIKSSIHDYIKYIIPFLNDLRTTLSAKYIILSAINEEVANTIISESVFFSILNNLENINMKCLASISSVLYETLITAQKDLLFEYFGPITALLHKLFFLGDESVIIDTSRCIRYVLQDIGYDIQAVVTEAFFMKITSMDANEHIARYACFIINICFINEREYTTKCLLNYPTIDYLINSFSNEVNQEVLMLFFQNIVNDGSICEYFISHDYLNILLSNYPNYTYRTQEDFLIFYMKIVAYQPTFFIQETYFDEFYDEIIQYMDIHLSKEYYEAIILFLNATFSTTQQFNDKLQEEKLTNLLSLLSECPDQKIAEDAQIFIQQYCLQINTC